MGTPSFRRLRRRRSRQDIELTRARWSLFFYVWGSLLTLGLATAQAIETLVALVEGRPPTLLLPLPRL